LMNTNHMTNMRVLVSDATTAEATFVTDM
jgi:hypothetical protein